MTDRTAQSECERCGRLVRWSGTCASGRFCDSCWKITGGNRDRPAQSAPRCKPWCGTGPVPGFRNFCTSECADSGRPLNPEPSAPPATFEELVARVGPLPTTALATAESPPERPGEVDREGNPRIYPCDECGTMRSKPEGGTTFTVCDECLDKLHAKPAPPADVAVPTRACGNVILGGEHGPGVVRVLAPAYCDKCWSVMSKDDDDAGPNEPQCGGRLRMFLAFGQTGKDRFYWCSPGCKESGVHVAGANKETP